MNLQNKKIVITGATSGIGLELIKQLQPYNPEIVAVGRNIDNIPKLPNVYPFFADVSTKEGADSVIDFALNKLGKIDCFIANAGFAYYERLNKPDWEHNKQIFDTNVLSPIYSLERMIVENKSNKHVFVLISSGFGQTYMPGYSLYCSTKYAVRGFALPMKYDLPENIKLCTVYPVAIETNFFNNAGGVDMPRPFLRQKLKLAVFNIIKDIQAEKESSYPYRALPFILWVSNLFPFSITIINYFLNKKFNRFFLNK